MTQLNIYPTQKNHQSPLIPHKTQFRLKQVRPKSIHVYQTNLQKPIDYYSHQQAIKAKIDLVKKSLHNKPKYVDKMSLTTNQFFRKESPQSRQSNSSRHRQTSRDSQKRIIMSRSIQNDKSRPSTFGRTSVGFYKQDIFRDQRNENYLGNYKIVNQIGKGTFSIVYEATKIQGRQLRTLSLVRKPMSIPDDFNSTIQNEHKLFAIKVYQKFKVSKDPHKFKNMRKQISIMQQLNHPNIVKLYQSVETLTRISLVLQHGGKISLLDHIKKNYPINIKEIKQITKQLAQCLAYIHSKGIVHRDLKLQNILIHQGIVKVIDFGFSTLTHPNQKLSLTCGTPNYMAPQVISKKDYIGTYADIWSFGVIVYAIAEGKHPFKAQTYSQLERTIHRGKLQFKRKQEGFSEFVKKILRQNPQERPSASDLVRSKWLIQ